MPYRDDRKDKGVHFSSLMTDLLQAFDFLPHNLLMAKLDAYGFKNYAFYDKKYKKRKN